MLSRAIVMWLLRLNGCLSAAEHAWHLDIMDHSAGDVPSLLAVHTNRRADGSRSLDAYKCLAQRGEQQR